MNHWPPPRIRYQPTKLLQIALLVFVGKHPPSTSASIRIIGRIQVRVRKQWLRSFINSTRSQVPPEVEHFLIWTKVPIYHSDLVDNSVKSRIDLDGLWGFTGNDSPPPSPSLLPSHLPALAEWGVTKKQIVVSASPTREEAVLIERAGKEVHRYIKNRWSESDWETAWFVNPPVSHNLVLI